MKRRILITGVAGFIGRHLTRHLHNQGHDIIGNDIVSAENVSLDAIAEYYQLDLTDRDAVARMVAATSPDVCIHAAGRASVPFSMAHPDVDFDSGPLVTFNLLNSLRLNVPECRFIFLSSAAVYGNPVTLPVAETMTCRPVSTYGYHKLVSENICAEFTDVYHISTAILRIFSAYGPGLRRQVVWDITSRILQGEELILHGTGDESRDFINVLDIIHAVGLIIEHSAFRADVYNLASGVETKIRDLASLIQRLVGNEARVSFDGANPEGNPLNWRADISKLQTLGFSPRVTLESGITSFMGWAKSDIMLS